MSYTVDFPIQYIPDPTQFGCIGLGNLYVGIVNGNPAANPADRIQVLVPRTGLSDLPIGQPIPLSAGGVPLYQGSPVSIKVNSAYSIAITDSLGAQIYYCPSAGNEITDLVSLDARVDILEVTAPPVITSWSAISAVTPTAIGQLFTLAQHTSGGFGGGTLMAFPGSVTDDGGTQKNALGGFYLKRINYTSTCVDMFGAIGNGTTNDSAAIQACLSSPNNKGSVCFESRNYKVTGNLTVLASLKEMFGIGNAKVTCGSQTGALESFSIYSVNDFTMTNIAFTADNINTVNNPLVFFGTCTNVKVNKCEIVNTGGIGIGASNSVSIRIDDNYFYNTGYGALAIPHGSAPAVIIQNTCSDAHLSNNRFELTNWSAAYFFATSGTIFKNTCLDCRESTFYCEGAKSLKISYNKIRCGAGVNIANFGIEYGQGYDFDISHNEIEGNQDACIGITNGNHGSITDNHCKNAGKGGGSVLYASAGILIREFVNVAVSSSKNLTIRGNHCFDDQPTKTQKYGLSFYVDPGAVPIQDITVEGNTLLGNLTAPVYIDTDVTLFQDTCIFRGNRGYAETSKTLTFAMTSGSTGIKTFGGFGFKPRKIRIQGQATTPDNSWIDITIVPSGNSAVTDGFSYFSALQHQATFCNLRAGAGTLILGADWTGGAATTRDGFTYNYTNNNANHTLTITCEP